MPLFKIKNKLLKSVRDILAGNCLAHAVIYGDFMAGNFMARYFLSGDFLALHVTVRKLFGRRPFDPDSYSICTCQSNRYKT